MTRLRIVLLIALLAALIMRCIDDHAAGPVEDYVNARQHFVSIDHILLIVRLNYLQPIIGREMRRLPVADNYWILEVGIVLASDADASHRAELELLPPGVDLVLQHREALVRRRRCTV